MENRFKNILDTVQLSEQDQNRIINACQKGRHVDNKWFLYSGRIAAAIVIAVVATTSVTAYAAVSAYQAYMESMSREEVQERYENVYEGTRGWTLYSRKLTEEEENRKAELQEEYRAGIRFPQQSMPYFNGETEEKPKDVEVSFDYVNEICYLPDRELTEEELLQIIDLYEKANYSLQEINKEIVTEVATTPAPVSPEDWGMSENQALTEEEWITQLSESAYTQLTGEDAALAEWEINIRGDAESGGERWYLAQFGTEELSGSICYEYDDKVDSWVIKRYNRTVKEAADIPANSYSEEEMQQKISAICEDATHKLKDVFGITDEIVKGEHDFGYHSKLLQVVLTTETGDRYRLYYFFSNEQIRDYSIYPVETRADFVIIEEGYATEFDITK